MKWEIGNLRTDDFLEQGKRLLDLSAKAASALPELLGDRFIPVESYWRLAARAIWRFYWALVLDRIPEDEDIAVVAALYFRTNDFAGAASRFLREFNKDWPLDEEKIKKRKFPIQPDQGIIESATMKYLRTATHNLMDLYRRDELPSVCLAHHEVFWSECPKCKELAGRGE